MVNVENRKLTGVERDVLLQRQLKLEKEFQEQGLFAERQEFKRAQSANPIKPRKRKKRKRRKRW